MISLVKLNHRFNREKLNEVKNWDLYKLIYKNLPNINLIWRNLWLFHKISKQILVLEKKCEWQDSNLGPFEYSLIVWLSNGSLNFFNLLRKKNYISHRYSIRVLSVPHDSHGVNNFRIDSLDCIYSMEWLTLFPKEDFLFLYKNRKKSKNILEPRYFSRKSVHK